MTLEKLLYFVLLLLPIIYGGIKFRKLDFAFKLLVIWQLYTFLSEIVGHIGQSNWWDSNSPPYHFNILVYMVLTWLIYRQFPFLKKTIVQLFFFICVFFVFLSIINSLYFQPINEKVFPTTGIILQATLMLLFSLTSFQQMLNNPTEFPLRKEPIFWLLTINLLFYSITFVGFSTLNFITSKIENLYWIFELIWWANNILNIVYFYAIYLNSSRK